MSKYIIKNCPAFESSTYYNPDMAIINACTLYDEPCENKYNCLLKQIVEKCKVAIAFNKKYGLKASDNDFPNEILQLMDIANFTESETRLSEGKMNDSPPRIWRGEGEVNDLPERE